MITRFRWWLARAIQPECSITVSVAGRPTRVDDMRDLKLLTLVHVDQALPYLTAAQQADSDFREKLILGDAALRNQRSLDTYQERLDEIKKNNQAVEDS